MSRAAGGAGRLRLPWLAVGPRSQGRGYGVTFRSEGLQLPRQANNRLDDFALALAAWADVAITGGAQGFAFCFQLADAGPWFIGRAKFMGRVGLGTVAAANGVLLAAELVEAGKVRPQALLPLINEPVEGSAPAPLEAPMSMLTAAVPDAPADLRLAADALSAFALYVSAEGPETPEQVMTALLDSPTAPRPMRGWCDTGRLARNGAFDPARVFPLIVHAPDDAPLAPEPQRRRLAVAGGKVVATDVPASTSRSVWQVIRPALEKLDLPVEVRAALARLVWKEDYWTAPPAAMVADMVAVAAEDLPAPLKPDGLLAFVNASRALQAHPGEQEEVRIGLAEAYRDLLQTDDPKKAAELIDTYIRSVSPVLGHVAPRMMSLEALSLGALPYVQPATLRELGKRGLLTFMADRTLQAVGAALATRGEGRLSTASLSALLDEVAVALKREPDIRPDSYELAGVLLEEAARRLNREPGSDGELQDGFWAVLRALLADERQAQAAVRAEVAMAVRDRRPAGARDQATAVGFRKLLARGLGQASSRADMEQALRAALATLGVTARSPWEQAA